MPLLKELLGRRVSSGEERIERVNSTEGIAVFGFDSPGSAANGTEAARSCVANAPFITDLDSAPLAPPVVGRQLPRDQP